MKNKVFMAIILFGSWLSIMHGSAFDFVYNDNLKKINQLIQAIKQGVDRKEIIKLLPTIPVEWANENKLTLLLVASEFGRNDIVTALIDTAIEQGIAPEDFVNQTGSYDVTALMLAAKNGHLAVVKQLLENGAKIYLREDDFTGMGKTALMFAAENGHQEVEKVLLENGANPKERDSYGNTYQMLKDKMLKRLAQEKEQLAE